MIAECGPAPHGIVASPWQYYSRSRLAGRPAGPHLCRSVTAWTITLVRSSVTVSASAWPPPELAIPSRRRGSEGSERPALFAATSPLPLIYLRHITGIRGHQFPAADFVPMNA
ncbi:hypothetical protein Y032_0086g1932 [Ancylostoma ceylanicum]|uniref:Uncharacterized protein n=1 Tax=Ancylostoma ceylanicum TaxID=53326 RepID=A0A016TQG8_9BILA|nr:hypothetical protein Y032_0086g1932 [Ancylostoma ceylanicum]